MVARMAIGLVAIWLLSRASGEGAELERSGDALGAAGRCQLAGGGGRRGRHRGRHLGRGRRGRPARPRCSSRSGRPAARSDRRCSSAPWATSAGAPPSPSARAGRSSWCGWTTTIPTAVSNEFVRAAVWTLGRRVRSAVRRSCTARACTARPRRRSTPEEWRPWPGPRMTPAYAARRQANGEWSSTQMLRPIDQSSVQRVTLASPRTVTPRSRGMAGWRFAKARMSRSACRSRSARHAIRSSRWRPTGAPSRTGPTARRRWRPIALQMAASARRTS